MKRKNGKRKSIIEFLKNVDLIEVIIFIAPLLGGLFTLGNCFFISLLCIIGILVKAVKNKKFKFPKDIKFAMIGIYVFSFLVVSLWAVDKGMSVMGFFKSSSIILFILLIMQYDYTLEKCRNLLNVVPYSAVCSLFLCVVVYVLGDESIFQYGRLNGIFYYANSYGLLLAIGTICMLFKNNLKAKDFCMLGILILGIILTNSRAIIILSFVFILIACMLNLKKGKRILFSLIGFICVFSAFYGFSVLENRINPDMLESGELKLRIAYYKDAFTMIKDNPMGHGFQGWWYKQGEIQSAPYDAKYVHCSVIQVLLDVGVIPTIALIIMLAMVFFDKRQTGLNRLIMLFILGHSIIDIDFEYIYFILIICTMINFNTIEIQKTKAVKIIVSMLILPYTILYLSGLCYAIGDYKSAYTLVPFYTDALQEQLYSVKTREEHIELANRIYKYNKNVSGVYEAFSNKAQQENDYFKALEHEKMMIKINTQSIEARLYYEDFLERAIEYYQQQGDLESVRVFEEGFSYLR